MIKKFLSKIAVALGLQCGANLFSQRTYDNALLLKAAGAVAASADGTLILDVGGTPNPICGFMEGDLVVDVTALEVDTNDESYTIIVEVSPDAAFGTAANIGVVGRMVIGAPGAAAKAPQGSAVIDTIGRYTLPVRNEWNGVTFQYMRLRTVVAGTIGSGGINYTAWLSKDE